MGEANKPDFGTCVECETKLNNRTIKAVSFCPLCKRPVCTEHLRSKLVNIPDFKNDSKKLKEIYKIIRQDYIDDTGHPCLPYTLDFWKEYDLERERKKQRERNNLDGFGYFTDEEIGRISLRSDRNNPTILQDTSEMRIEIPKPYKPTLWELLKRKIGLQKDE